MEETLRLKIIKKIENDSAFFKSHPSKPSRLFFKPIRTCLYYSLTAIAYLFPFKVKYKTNWNDVLTFYLPEGGAIYYYGFFEANLTNFFLRFLKKGDVFVDIGAHIGYYSNLCAHLVGQSGQVHSFEPTPRTYKSLVENTQNLSQVKTNNCALLDTETTITFIDYGPKYSAFNTFEKRTGSDLSFLKKEECEINVPAITLDSYPVSPSFVKIDAEGADHLVLTGMKEVIQKSRPIISLEVAGGEEWKKNHEESISLLASLLYEAYEISDAGFLSKHTPKTSYTYDNLIFIPNEKINQLETLIRQS